MFSWTDINLKELITVSFTLFAVIDIIGSIPVLASLRIKMEGRSGLLRQPWYPAGS